MITKSPPKLRLSHIVLYGLSGLGIAAFIWSLISLPFEAGQGQALCDYAVKALYSDSLIEVTRAGIIIRNLRCDIRKKTLE